MERNQNVSIQSARMRHNTKQGAVALTALAGVVDKASLVLREFGKVVGESGMTILEPTKQRITRLGMKKLLSLTGPLRIHFYADGHKVLMRPNLKGEMMAYSGMRYRSIISPYEIEGPLMRRETAHLYGKVYGSRVIFHDSFNDAMNALRVDAGLDPSY